MTPTEAAEHIKALAEDAVDRHAQAERDPEKCIAYAMMVSEWATDALQRIVAAMEAELIRATVH